MIPGAKFLFHIREVGFDPAVVFSIEHYIQGDFWGGLLAYMLLAIPVTLLLARNRKAALDLVAVSVPIPWAMAKLGCLLNGCCYGKPCSLPWGITFPEGGGAPASATLHPTQIYEIIMMGLLVVVFMLLRSERWRGTMLLWFVGIYGSGRVAIDIFRGDADRYIYIVGPVTLTQLICAAAAVISIGLLLLSHRSMAKKENTTASSS